METVESSLLPGAQPGSRIRCRHALQKGAHYTNPVHLYFRVLYELTVCLDSFCQPGECGSCLRPNESVELGLKGEVRDR